MTNHSEENPVNFHSQKDIFGQDEKLVNPLRENSLKDKALLFSDYQSVKHFCLLCIFSFGVYPFFWFFKHWQYLRDENKRDINPSYRTVFTLFYGYALFTEFETLAIEQGYKKKLPLFILFVLYLLFTLLISIKGNPLMLCILFSFIFLIPVHRMINFYYINVQGNLPIRKKLSKGEKQFLLIFWLYIITTIILGLLF